jgi:hypothetical protein
VIAEPKPPSGLSSEASWHRQLLRWIKGWVVLSIEGYRVAETTNGRVFKKESMQPPLTKGGGRAGWQFANLILYDNESSYSFQDVVYVSPDDSLVTEGYEDPDSEITVYAVAGMWVALQDVSPKPDPDISGSFVYHIPQLPYPVPGDPDNALNYWWFISPDAVCY